MPRFVHRDFDEFAAHIQGVDGRFVPTGVSTGEWWIDIVDAGTVSVQRLQVGGATTFAGDGTAEALTLGIPLTDPARVLIDGQAFDGNSFIAVRLGAPFALSAMTLSRWAGITLPVDLPLLSPWVREASLKKGSVIARTRAVNIARLRALVARVADCGRDGFESLAARAAAEEEIVLAAARVLEPLHEPDGVTRGRPRVARRRVIAAALDVMDAKRGEHASIADLCRAAHVSERTLRNVFKEYFGVSPTKLLRVRQMRQVRAALVEEGAAGATVSSIAARYGVWDFSALARDYRALFGELPSETLRARGAKPPEARGSWLGYADRLLMER